MIQINNLLIKKIKIFKIIKIINYSFSAKNKILTYK